jgi:hypothetical protein
VYAATTVLPGFDRVFDASRFGPEYVIDPVDDFTRLTFDTAALCTMSYRFNSFYRVQSSFSLGSRGLY